MKCMKYPSNLTCYSILEQSPATLTAFSTIGSLLLPLPPLRWQRLQDTWPCPGCSMTRTTSLQAGNVSPANSVPAQWDSERPVVNIKQLLPVRAMEINICSRASGFRDIRPLVVVFRGSWSVRKTGYSRGKSLLDFDFQYEYKLCKHSLSNLYRPEHIQLDVSEKLLRCGTVYI